jgi:alkyl-hydroperoxide reductase/thiol specific antioxidant family protein
LRDHEAEFRARGANLAAVGLGDAAYAKAFREESRITFPLLVDAERAAYRAAELRSATLSHLLRRDNFVARRRARAAGHRQGKTGANPFQLGGSFVFGPGDVDRYAHVSETFGDAAPVSQLLAALDR